MKTQFALSLPLILIMAGCSQDISNKTVTSEAPSCADYDEAYNLYWGDLHVHTAYSMDAYIFGTKASPADTFSFAKGITEQKMPDGTAVRLERPLDFMAITDHAETFGLMHICTEPDHANYQSEYCQQLRGLSGTDARSSVAAFRQLFAPISRGQQAPLCDREDLLCEIAAIDRWNNVQRAANTADAPCEFSAFLGYEWSATPNDAHWHRNIIFKNDAATEGLVDFLRFPTPERMWAELESQCRPEEGCEVLAIPHNTNLSEGGGFDVENATTQELRRRERYERLIEITQHKGTSECLNENWDDRNSDCGFEQALSAKMVRNLLETPSIREDYNRSFGRNILGRGLQSYATNEAAINPLQIGFIGSTDNHSATPGLTEEAFWKGDSFGGGDVQRPRWLAGPGPSFSPGGLVGVWAKQNTRADIFDGLKDRHAYATSGTRISLKFAAVTSGNDTETCNAKLLSGSPMGSTLSKKRDEAPEFIIAATQDLVPLERIQIVKGSLKAGQVQEEVLTIKSLDEGFEGACESWSDPDFDPNEPAYWYTRVLEVPTPRWSKLLCEDLGNCSDFPSADIMISERAWSSPIWYLPPRPSTQR